MLGGPNVSVPSANADEKTTNGRTPLQVAIRFGANDIVQLLVDRGADLTLKDRFGRTPLEAAEFEAPQPTIELMRKLTAQKKQ